MSASTFALAGLLCAAPVIVPGVAIYVILRARLRSAWREEHKRNGVADEWLAHTSRRFG